MDASDVVAERGHASSRDVLADEVADQEAEQCVALHRHERDRPLGVFAQRIEGPADWALSEDQQRPTYEEALRRVGLPPGQLVLDIGCGVGAFLRLVAERGARPFGLDASEALLDVARERVPDAELRVGEIDFVSRPSTAITRRRASRLAVMTRCRRASTP